jgi:hypothetical protein
VSLCYLAFETSMCNTESRYVPAGTPIATVDEAYETHVRVGGLPSDPSSIS